MQHGIAPVISVLFVRHRNQGLEKAAPLFSDVLAVPLHAANNTPLLEQHWISRALTA